MYQPSLLPHEYTKNDVVNVSHVPQRSPFRYPGGKTWLIPRIREWLFYKKNKPKEFIEPFAGGAIVGLTVAFEDLADHVTLVELDEDVSSVWKTILSNECEWLVDRIISLNLTNEYVDRALSTKPKSTKEKALQTIIRNRVNRGGILANGAGRIKKGENGKGIKSRWYPETLKKRMLAINKLKDKITFIQGDGLDYMKKNIRNKNVIFFVDPPYTASHKRAGSRLYKYHELDHDLLFSLASKAYSDVLMTYDNADEVKNLSAKYKLDFEPIAMKNTHHAKMSELIIAKKLDWLRR